jgi:hypothetical protein
MFYPMVQSQREHTALKFGGSVYVEPEVETEAVARNLA